MQEVRERAARGYAVNREESEAVVTPVGVALTLREYELSGRCDECRDAHDTEVFIYDNEGAHPPLFDEVRKFGEQVESAGPDSARRNLDLHSDALGYGPLMEELKQLVATASRIMGTNGAGDLILGPRVRA